ncbi:MAG: class I SAM-dependent methyltransferase [Thermoplasmata archaeon]
MTSGRILDRRTHRAVRGFDRSAGTYERGRPDYPAEVIEHLARALHLGPGQTIVELGSGTGKFTRALRPLGAAIVPVEPTRGMREEFARQVPDLSVLDGTAEAIPVPDGFADAVLVAQAFHWFRTRAALREIARVLRPGGGLGLVWNMRDERVPWMREFTRILEEYDWGVPRTRQRRWRPVFERGGIPFGPLQRRTFHHVQQADVPGVVARALSVSVIAVQSTAEQRKVALRIRELLASDPMTRGRPLIDVPYRTEVYWCRRTGTRARAHTARTSQPYR